MKQVKNSISNSVDCDEKEKADQNCPTNFSGLWPDPNIEGSPDWSNGTCHLGLSFV